MRRKICKKCGREFDAPKSSSYLCPDCSQKAKGATVILDRVCRQCGVVFPGGPRAWYCPKCRQERRQEQNRNRKREGTKRPLGSTDTCARCGAEYIVQSGRQKYCKDCAAVAMRENVNKHKAQYAREHRAEYTARKQAAAKVCIVCGKPFVDSTPSVTCSAECAQKHRRAKWAEADVKRGKRKPPQ